MALRSTLQVLSAAALLLGAGFVAPAGLSGQEAQPLSVRTGSAVTPLRPGDRVEMVIWRNAEYSGTYTVAEDGTLLHPLLSTVQVAGVDLAVAKQRMADFLRQNAIENPVFLFQPMYRIYVGGAVSRQGQYYVPGGTVGQAIVEAGGSTTPNRRLRVRLIRGGISTLAVLDGGSEAELLQTPVQSGDQILLEDRPTFSRTYLNPALQVLQTLTGLVATYVYLDAIFGGE